MAKGSDDITMTLKLEGKDIGPVRLNMQVSKKIAVAGGESGIMSAIASTTGLDVINRAAAGRTFVFVHNTGTTNAIQVWSAPTDGSTLISKSFILYASTASPILRITIGLIYL